MRLFIGVGSGPLSLTTVGIHFFCRKMHTDDTDWTDKNGFFSSERR